MKNSHWTLMIKNQHNYRRYTNNLFLKEIINSLIRILYPFDQAKLLRSSGVIEKIDELDDIITLEDCNTKEPVQWNFPNITQCPVELCRREFGSRFDAFNHFKRRHLKNAQYCSECAEPIEVYRQEDVQEHERRAHLSGNDASDFDQLSNVSRPSTSTAENV